MSKKTKKKIFVIITLVLMIILALFLLKRCSQKEKYIYKEPGVVEYNGKIYKQREDLELFLGFLKEDVVNRKNKKVILLTVDRNRHYISAVNFDVNISINAYSTLNNGYNKTTIKDLNNTNELDKGRSYIDEKISMSDFMCNMNIDKWGMASYQTLQDLLDITENVDVNGVKVTNVESLFNIENEKEENKFIKNLFERCVEYYKNDEEAIEKYLRINDVFTNDLLGNLKWGKTLNGLEIRTVVNIDETWDNEKIKDFIFNNYYEAYEE